MWNINTNSPEAQTSFQTEGIKTEGIDLETLPIGAVLEVRTGGHTYRMVNRGDGRVLISGHPRHCPVPVLALLADTLMRGMRLQFEIPHHGVVATSPIEEVRTLNHLVC